MTIDPKLLRIRDELLRLSGFVDLEGANPNGLLRNPGRIGEAKQTAEQFSAAVDYAYLASGYVFEGHFATELERHVWELHAEGVSFEKIAARLDHRQYGRVYLKRVWQIIDRHRTIMCGVARRRRGRPREATALRRTGVAVEAELGEVEVLALDAIRGRISGAAGRPVSDAEVVRLALRHLANRLR